MPTVTTISGQSRKTPLDRPWPAVLWREWRNTGDDVYAEHLFSLLVLQPISRRVLAALIGLGAIAGVLIGWLYPLWANNGDVSDSRQAMAAALGLIVGGLLVGIVAMIPQRVRYGHLLKAITPMTFDPESPLTGRLQKLAQFAPFGVGLGFLFSAQIALTMLVEKSAINLGQMQVFFYSLLTLGLLTVFRPYRNFFKLIGQVLQALIAGLLLLIGVVFALNLLDFDLFQPSGWQVQFLTLCSGLLGGLLGWQVWGRAGMIIGLIWAGAMLALATGWGLYRLDVIWLLGLLLAGSARSISRLWPTLRNLLSFGRAYPYRRWYVWWARPPLLTEVSRALRGQATDNTWQTALQQLDAELDHLKSPTALIDALTSDNWMDRFVAPHVLVRLGSEPVEPLLALVNRAEPSLRRTVRRILDTISYDTTHRLGQQAPQLLCVDCLTFCAEYTEQVGKKSLTYYGCRACGQSWEFWLAPQQTVVAVLDAGWTEPHEEANGALRLNYFQRDRLFDFTEVEIEQASDEQIERFAVRVGNDTDPLRRERYPSMRCVVRSSISANNLRILENTFGEVVQ